MTERKIEGALPYLAFIAIVVGFFNFFGFLAESAAIMGALGIMGVAVSVVMIGIGLFWAIPNLGPFGLIWTSFAVFIAIANLRRLLTKR